MPWSGLPDWCRRSASPPSPASGGEGETPAFPVRRSNGEQPTAPAIHAQSSATSSPTRRIDPAYHDLARCGGCGEPIRPGERVYDYHPQRGTEVVARCHSENLACLIAWNARWHVAEGREYDADLYRQHPEG